MGCGGLLSRRLRWPFFIEFLKVGGLFDAWVKDCPLVYSCNNAPDKPQGPRHLLTVDQSLPSALAMRLSPAFTKTACIPASWGSQVLSPRTPRRALLRLTYQQSANNALKDGGPGTRKVVEIVTTAAHHKEVPLRVLICETTEAARSSTGRGREGEMG